MPRGIYPTGAELNLQLVRAVDVDDDESVRMQLHGTGITSMPEVADKSE